MSAVHVYLVPGFFGFLQLGDLNYFHGVRDALAGALERRGVAAKIFRCQTHPTGSLKTQADSLIQQVIDSGGLEADDIHLVGHSTGGLNARLIATPQVKIRDGRVEELIGSKIRNVTTISAPHFGTPLAQFFTSVQGRRFLQLSTLLTNSANGRRVLFLAMRTLSAAARLDDIVGRNETFLDELSEHLLRKVTYDREDPLWKFLRDVAKDQGAVSQITPESMQMFNATVSDRPYVNYYCLATAAPPPRAFDRSKFKSLEIASLFFLYALLYRISARESRRYPYPDLDEAIVEAMKNQLPFELSKKTNDGVVPTASQFYGELLGVVVADHLDVVGRYADPQKKSFSDWLPSGSGFDAERFGHAWESVADGIARSRV